MKQMSSKLQSGPNCFQLTSIRNNISVLVAIRCLKILTFVLIKVLLTYYLLLSAVMRGSVLRCGFVTSVINWLSKNVAHLRHVRGCVTSTGKFHYI